MYKAITVSIVVQCVCSHGNAEPNTFGTRLRVCPFRVTCVHVCVLFFLPYPLHVCMTSNACKCECVCARVCVCYRLCGARSRSWAFVMSSLGSFWFSCSSRLFHAALLSNSSGPVTTVLPLPLSLGQPPLSPPPPPLLPPSPHSAFLPLFFF